MEAGDLGAPSSHLVAFSGIPVVSGDGAVVGTLMHVLSGEPDGALEGIVIDASAGAGGARFVDAQFVAGFYERGVTLLLDRASCAELPRPQPPPTMSDPGVTLDPRGLEAKLLRAWEVLSGGR